MTIFKLTKKQALWILSHAFKDATRPHLNAVKVEGSRLVATDGHRLGLIHDSNSSNEKEYLIPAAALAAVVKTMGNKHFLHLKEGDREGVVSWTVSLWDNPDMESVFSGELKCLDAQFPPWKQVVPATLGGGSFVALRAEYLAEVVALAPLVHKRLGGVSIAVQGQLDPVVIWGEDSATGLSYLNLTMPMNLQGVAPPSKWAEQVGTIAGKEVRTSEPSPEAAEELKKRYG